MEEIADREARLVKDDGSRLRRIANESRGRVLELERRIEQLQSALTGLEEENRQLLVRLDELQRSTSWRVTRPLRGLKSMMSKGD